MTTITKQSIEAAKVATLTDAQIVKQCLPKLDYYNQTRKNHHRLCMFCLPPTDAYGYKAWRGYATTAELETHYMESHTA